jgi:hypothetical protein
VSESDQVGGNEALQRIISRFWTTPDRSEWTPKTDVIPLSDLREWMKSSDIEIVGFAYHMTGDARFRIEPPLSVEEFVDFIKHYYERCLRENPDGNWADSRFTVGYDLVNIFASLWRDQQVPRTLLYELKNWFGVLYKCVDEEIRFSMVQATFEHLVEDKSIREFFSDWREDPVLRIAYEEACLWPDGGGSTPLGKPPMR